MVLPGVCAAVQLPGQNGEFRPLLIRVKFRPRHPGHLPGTARPYFSTARLDFVATQKIRLFGSWLYQYARESGASLPAADSVNGLLNSGVSTGVLALPGINTPITQFSHSLGFSAPNATFNVGADISLTPKIVSTTRYGYFFTNYHDFGWPTHGR